MRNTNSKSLSNTLKDKLKFEFDSKYLNKSSNLVQDKTLNKKISNKSDNFQQNTQQNTNQNTQQNTNQNTQINNRTQSSHPFTQFQPKTIFSVYKNNTKNLSSSHQEDKKKFNLTDRNFKPQFSAFRGLSKEQKGKHSYLVDILNETNKSNQELISPSHSKDNKKLLKSPQNSSHKEKSSVLKIMIKQNPTKSGIMESQHFRKTNVSEVLPTRQTSTKRSELKYNNTHQSPPKNNKILYSELASHLKSKQDNYPSGDLNQCESSNRNLNSKLNYTPNMNEENENFKINKKLLYSGEESPNTKDDTFTSLKFSNNNISLKNKNILVQIENPEELHNYNVFLIQQSKSLAYKFENLQRDFELENNNSTLNR